MRIAGVLLGVALGGAAGWLAHERFGTSAPAEPSGQEGSRTGGGASSSTVGPALAGRSEPGAETLAEETARAARALENRRGGVVETTRARGFTALAALQALAGNEAEFLRVAHRALALGGSLNDLLPALAEFDPQTAARLLAGLLDRAGDVPYDAVEVGTMLVDGGQAEKALALVRKTVTLRSVPEPGLLRLLLRLDPEKGPDLLLGLEASAHWDSDTLGVLRAALVEAGKDRALIPFLTRALATRPGDSDLLRWLARVDRGAAEERLRSRLSDSPDDARAWGLLADLRRDAGDAAGAFEAYRRAAELNPGRSSFRDLVRADPARGLEFVIAATRDSQDDERLGALGEAYLVAGRKEDALAAFLRAHEHDPADRMWIERMIALDPAATAATLERRIAAAPDAATSDLLGRYGQALAAAGRRDDAYQQYLAAFRKDPAASAWQEALAQTDARRALPLLEGRVREHPSDASAAGAYGLALLGSGRRDEAFGALQGALAHGDAERWFPPLAGIDPERALQALDARARSDYYDPGLWALLGAQLRQRNRPEEARRAYEAALRLDPSNRSLAEAVRDLR